jgi:hypothetical protein
VRRFCSVAACSLALAGCRIEQTPQQYIDRRDTPADQLLTSEAELTRRLLEVSDAMRSNDTVGLETILALHPEVIVYGPASGEQFGGGPGIARSLSDFANGRVLVPDVNVQVGPQNNVAWFRATYEDSTTSVSDALRFTGVFLRQDTAWQLVLGHISVPATLPPPRPATLPDSSREAG